MAEVDADRYLRIVGRRKDIIIRGGENISPAEVEGLLFDHPMIAQLSIVGIADERLGQRAVAFVVPAADMQPTLKALTQWLDDKGVAKFKWPERLEIIDSLPMTPSGKVRKEELRALLTAQAPA
ncbi:AMP-binding enzyme [Rhizorhabdus wittichii]|uniref:AMP-binding enzyme n=1 Tax=Rhizorhabdus wittichii TaxID=160791 RepID=UPI001ABF7244